MNSSGLIEGSVKGGLWKQCGLMLLVVAGSATHAVEPEGTEPASEPAVSTVESENGSLERFFYDVWTKLKFSGLGEDIHVTDNVVVTAGIRGFEPEEEVATAQTDGQTVTEEDLEVEAAVYSAYKSAIAKARAADPKGLELFLEEHGQTKLAPNARFALAVYHAHYGDRETAIERLERFAQDHPSHQFSDEAKSLIRRLEG